MSDCAVFDPKDQDVQALRVTLLADGYEPVAVHGKRPVATGWQSGSINPARISNDLAEFPNALSTGLRTGALVGVDIDVWDAEEAEEVRRLVEDQLGKSAFQRIGQKGMLLCYRNAEPIKKITVGFSESAREDKTKVEILGVGQQFVAYGIHPDTGKLYYWPTGAEPALFPFDDLPAVTPEQLRDLAPQLVALLGRKHPGIMMLGGPGVRLAAQVLHFPDRSNLPPLSPEEIRGRLFVCDPDMGRDQWRNLIAAVRATPCSDPKFEARDLVQEWSATATRVFDDDPAEAAARVYDTMPPRAGGVGAGTLVSLSDRAGYTGPTVARRSQRTIHEAFPQLIGMGIEEMPSAARAYLAQAGEGEAVRIQHCYPEPLSMAELIDGNFPQEQFLIDGYLLDKEPQGLHGLPGSGKTSVGRHMAVSVASGRPFFGNPVNAHNGNKPRPVLFIEAEDKPGPMKARFEAIGALPEYAALGLDIRDLPIDVWCLPGEDVRLVTIDDQGRWTPEPFMLPFLRRLEKSTALGDPLVFFDTLIDISTHNANLRPPVNTFYKKVLGGLCAQFGATPVVLAHPSVASILDHRNVEGSNSNTGSVRNALFVEWPKTDEAKRVLRTQKGNYSDTGSGLELWMGSKNVLVAAPPLSAPEGKNVRDIVRREVLDLVDRGIDVVQDGRGRGQNPADLAKAINAKHGLRLREGNVRDHLKALERDGVLAYVACIKGKKPRNAHYERGE